MSNGVLANKQPANLPQTSNNNFQLNNSPNKGVIFDQQTASNNSIFKKDFTEQEFQQQQHQHQQGSSYKQSTHSSIDSEGNRIAVVKRLAEAQEIGTSCMVRKGGVNSVIVSSPSSASSSVARICDCQSQQRHPQRCRDHSGGSNLDTSGHLAEPSGNKYQTNAASHQFHQERRRSANTDFSGQTAYNRTSSKRLREEVEQTSAPVVAVEASFQLAKLLANNSTSNAQDSHENSQKLNPENQRDCEQHDEIDEDADFDYDKVLSNVLNEKKLALLNSPDVTKYIQQIQHQYRQSKITDNHSGS